MSFRETVKKIPVVGNLLLRAKRYVQYKTDKSFAGSFDYWESRYNQGGNSGSGSYGRLAVFKAEVINEFLKMGNVQRAIELGCGDGNQLNMIGYKSYIGLDISSSAIRRCINNFKADPTKAFYLFDPKAIDDKHGLFKCDLSLSLDVIYHIIEDENFEAYMRFLFNTSTKYVIVYSSNFDSYQMKHVKHRDVTGWISKNIPGWKFMKEIVNPYPHSDADPDNTSSANFYFFEKG